ncbi:MAG: uroporphyrinogen decarboxylase [Eubacteriaceae bacterium]|nr:uroporphyrinogen decarboxylase [Eubacteriaceae bacterium]
MSTDGQAMAGFRKKMFYDLYSGIIPERFPIYDCATLDFMIQYAGKSPFEIVYNYDADTLYEIFEKNMEYYSGDTFGAAARNPAGLMFKKSKVNVMSKSGMVQHPETSGFTADEYDEFIAHPYDFSLEKILPRLNPGFDMSRIHTSVNFTKYVLAQMDYLRATGEATGRMAAKYGFFSAPRGSSAVQPIPFDFLADFCRGFIEVPVDIRRCPQKVIDACEALVPYLMWRSVNPVTDVCGANQIMTHMGTFLQKKDFEKFYWPTFFEMVHMIAERGQSCYLFCEDDWERYIDYLQDLPQGTRLHFEYGNPKEFKDRLGSKMVIGGFYSVVDLKTGTPQKCVDKAKELVDIMAPGGNFEFRFDKSALRLGDINIENHNALMSWLLDNASYENAGQQSRFGSREDTIHKFSHKYPKFESKYIISFDEWVKDYPPPVDKLEPYMRNAYEKYSATVQPYNDIYSLFG